MVISKQAKKDGKAYDKIHDKKPVLVAIYGPRTRCFSGAGRDSDETRDISDPIFVNETWILRN